MIKTTYISKNINERQKDFIYDCELHYMNTLQNIADSITEKGADKSLILISGPSGSGKTTTAIKLSKLINKLGYSTCYISMDKYFKNFSEEEKALKAKGKLDLESPERLDKDFLVSELKKLMNDETIYVPSYEFATNTRTMTNREINRNGGFIIVEGIHALNDEVLGDLEQYATKIYVSVRTRILGENGDKMHPSKIRLMRRMMRDKLFRGRSIEETIKMYPKVQRGENLYIMPNKSKSDFDVDTFIPYEIGAYEYYLKDDMHTLATKFADTKDMYRILDEIEITDIDLIPKDSLVREFIGDSEFHY